MTDIQLVVWAVGLPFLGTTIGALFAYFVTELNETTKEILYGLSAGIMLAASIFSLLIPSIESAVGRFNWLPALSGFLVGALFMLVIDIFSERFFSGASTKAGKIAFAISVHNLPEGMAVGIAVLFALNGGSAIGALALSLGVAIQNLPEGAVTSMPLVTMGVKKNKAVLVGVFSAVIELIGALSAFLWSNFIGAFLPFMLAFSAGAMQWVTFRELLPETKSISGGCCVMLGFALMMVLDVALG